MPDALNSVPLLSVHCPPAAALQPFQQMIILLLGRAMLLAQDIQQLGNGVVALRWSRARTLCQHTCVFHSPCLKGNKLL
jgi:hypothetical protein